MAPRAALGIGSEPGMKIVRSSALLCSLALLMTGRAAGQQLATPGDVGPPAQESHEEAVADQPAAVPVTGSQIPHAEIQCATCHTEPSLWDADKQKLYISQESLESDVHWQKGVACSDCHGGDPASLNYAAAHAGFTPLGQVRQRCVVCHNDQRLGLLKGVHAKAGEQDDRGRRLPLDCGQCHGTNAHAIFPAKDHRSPVFLNNQVRTCGSCHPEDRQTYENTVHGKGLNESGLMVTAVCADCHGAHGIYYAADRRSTLHISNVAATCSKCHQFIEERLQKSVHGRGGKLGSATEQPAEGGRIKRMPGCTDCHQGHHLLSSDLPEFRQLVASSCGNCHAEMSSHYALSMHSELTEQGYTAAANCADCHGSHDVLPVDDPSSRLAAGENRLHTCQKCHVHAVSNFADFDPHANFKDAARFPTLHADYDWIKFSLNFFFACFLLHAFLWFVRALVDRLQHGGHATLVSNQYALLRFGSIQRATYAALTVAFLGLTLTGLALKYSDQEWGQWLARGLGGFRSASAWHNFFAVLAIVAFVVQLGGALTTMFRLRQERTWTAIILGPDSLVPNGRDVRDFFKMLGWFIGFGKKPGFEKWTYWEKLDYWGFLFAASLIGISGFMLWFPNLTCLVFPGRILNVAKMVHSEFAIYMASFLFLIHFFHAHFRPEKFPMDLSVLTGMVSEEHLRKYRPEYVARLEREGKLGDLREAAPSSRSLWLNVVGGLLVFTVGLFLLTVTLLASLSE
jgi:cytochrome b subunit of formate dehydrogenase